VRARGIPGQSLSDIASPSPWPRSCSVISRRWRVGTRFGTLGKNTPPQQLYVAGEIVPHTLGCFQNFPNSATHFSFLALWRRPKTQQQGVPGLVLIARSHVLRKLRTRDAGPHNLKASLRELTLQSTAADKKPGIINGPSHPARYLSRRVTHMRPRLRSKANLRRGFAKRTLWAK